MGSARLHTDEDAAEAATGLQADAFAVGRDVFFARGAYRPESPEGARLLRHELAHVEQAPEFEPIEPGTGADLAPPQHPGERAARAAESGRAASIASSRGPRPLIFRHPVAPTTISRHSIAAINALTLSDFEAYTRRQADWFSETSLSATDRTELWSLLLRVSTSTHLLSGVGDQTVATLRSQNAASWALLEAFSRACDPTQHTIQIASATAYSLADRQLLGGTLQGLESLLPPEVLELTVSEQQLVDVKNGGLLFPLMTYWVLFQPHVQEVIEGARGPEFQRILDLLTGPGIAPFLSLRGRIRNLHRFTVPTLTKLVANYGDFSRSRPVHLVLFTGSDAGSFQAAASDYEDLVVNSPNNVLILEGRASLAEFTIWIPIISAIYGQPDSTGTPRVAQAMISGHGGARSVALAGTGTPSVSSGSVEYPTESIDLDTNRAASELLMDTLMSNLDPATARLVYDGCLVGSNPVPLGSTASAAAAHIATTPSLGTFTEQRGMAHHGLSAGFVQAARASTGRAAGLMDASGNLAIQYPNDPNAFGAAAPYVATGREAEGVMRAAVEVAATMGPVGPQVAEALLRARLAGGQLYGGDPWWEEHTLAAVRTALKGVAPGSGVSIARVNQLAHVVGIPFVARYQSSFAISVSHFTGTVNAQPVAADLYAEIIKTPTFTSPPDADARAMRLILEQGWLALGSAREAALIGWLDTTAAMTAEVIADHLDTSALSSSTLFPSGAAASSGRVRLALAWLMTNPGNPDVRAFLDSHVVAGPALDAALTAELGRYTERSVLLALGRLTPTAPAPSGAVLPAANVPIQGSTSNIVRVEPDPHAAEVLPHALRVHRGPRNESTVFHYLSRGTRVNVMGYAHGWAAIDANGALGFVYGTHLRRLP
jgi:hypothetical protein